MNAATVAHVDQQRAAIEHACRIARHLAAPGTVVLGAPSAWMLEVGLEAMVEVAHGWPGPRGTCTHLAQAAGPVVSLLELDGLRWECVPCRLEREWMDPDGRALAWCSCCLADPDWPGQHTTVLTVVAAVILVAAACARCLPFMTDGRHGW